jgi:hypothetical protein
MLLLNGAIPPIPLCMFMAWTWNNLPFYLYFYSWFTQRKIFNIFGVIRKRKKEERKKAFLLQT